MSDISKVFYQEIPGDEGDIIKAARYYYLMNMLGLSPQINQEFEKHELTSSRIRNRILGDAIRKGECVNPKLDTAIMGISPVHKKVVVMVDCE